MTKLIDVQDEIERLKAESQRLQDTRTTVSIEIEELRVERDGLLIAAEIDGDKKAQARVDVIDVDLTKKADLIRALESEVIRTAERIDYQQQSEQQLTEASGRALVGKAMQTLDGMVVEFSIGLFELTKISDQAMKLCSATQKQLVAMGLEPGAIDYRRFRNAVSPRILASLGRTSKLNLNASITAGARDWMEKARSDTAKPKPRPMPNPEKDKTVDTIVDKSGGEKKTSPEVKVKPATKSRVKKKAKKKAK